MQTTPFQKFANNFVRIYLYMYIIFFFLSFSVYVYTHNRTSAFSPRFSCLVCDAALSKPCGGLAEKPQLTSGPGFITWGSPGADARALGDYTSRSSIARRTFLGGVATRPPVAAEVVAALRDLE